MVKIKELKPGMKDINIVVTVDYIPKRTKKYSYGTSSRYLPTYVVDDEGNEIKLTFWGNIIDKIKEGMKVHLKKAYVTEFRGEIQLNYKEDSPPEIIK